MSTEADIEVNDPKNMELNVIDQGKESNEIEPTTEELNTLKHISDRIPTAAWLIVVCELCERFAFYGLSGPFQNYIQFPVPGPNDKQSGALNRGQQTATSLTTFFQFFCYLTPIGGAIVADQFWGKYKTIFVSCLIYLIGLSVLVLTSIPPSIHAGVALPGLIIAIIILGIGTGGVKSNVSPLMADQYTRKTPIVIGKINSSLNIS
jgi:POT family proton-dependent oligopeptide transporter